MANNKKITIQHLYATGATQPIPDSALTFGEIAINATTGHEGIYIKTPSFDGNNPYSVITPLVTYKQDDLLTLKYSVNNGISSVTLNSIELNEIFDKWLIFNNSNTSDDIINTLKEIQSELDKYKTDGSGEYEALINEISTIVGNRIEDLTNKSITDYLKQKEKTVLINGDDIDDDNLDTVDTTKYLFKVFGYLKGSNDNKIYDVTHPNIAPFWGEYAAEFRHTHGDEYLSQTFMDENSFTINCGSWDNLVE